LADLDGQGLLQVLAAPPDLDVEVDGMPAKSSHFTRDLVATSFLPGRFQALALSGPPPARPFEGVAGTASGPGWVEWNGQRLILDEGAQTLRETRLSGPLLLPISCGFASKTPLPWLSAPFELRDLDRFVPALEGARSPRKFRVQNMSAPQVLVSQDDAGSLLEGVESCHLNPAAWTLALAEGTEAVLITKTYDRFHGRQRARVLVDGAFVGWWHLPRQDRKARWGIAHFWIPRSHVLGKDQVEVTIDPPAGVPLWSVGEIRLRALVRR
jgi:hypothetical protein